MVEKQSRTQKQMLISMKVGRAIRACPQRSKGTPPFRNKFLLCLKCLALSSKRVPGMGGEWRRW